MAVTQRRKLLTAAVGVATVSYVVACGGLGEGWETSGNLVAPGGFGGAETSGNLVAPGGSPTVFPEQGGSGGYGGGETSGNLVAPPPMGGSGGVPVAVDAGVRDAAPSESGGDAAAEPGDAALDSGP
jgi:hypothetical protein